MRVDGPEAEGRSLTLPPLPPPPEPMLPLLRFCCGEVR